VPRQLGLDDHPVPVQSPVPDHARQQVRARDAVEQRAELGQAVDVLAQATGGGGGGGDLGDQPVRCGLQGDVSPGIAAAVRAAYTLDQRNVEFIYKPKP
jgi:hypothetical protein